MSIKNFKLTIQYDGTSYSGWQIQKDQDTIQGKLKDCIGKIARQDNVNVVGSGRTDSGVHALGQVANFKIDTNMDEEDLRKAINANIPKDIKVINSEIVDEKFNSRFSAKKREYIYKIKKTLSPFDYKYYWLYKYDINIDTLNKCAAIILENKDFSNFCRKSPDIEDYSCSIYKSLWNIENNVLEYNVKANRFLHHMVRMLVGTMLEVSRGRLEIEEFEKMLNNNVDSKKILTAPAMGLYLYKVYYD